MISVVALWRIVAQHSIATWRLLAVLALGVLVAATLLASAPIYARAMADLGLVFTVRDELRGDPVIRAGLATTELATEDAVRQREAVQARIGERVGWFEADRSLVLTSARLTVGATPDAPRAGEVLGVVYGVEGYEPFVDVIEGRLPEPTGPGGPLEVAMSEPAARIAGLAAGDAFFLTEEYDTCTRIIPQGLEPQPPCDLTATVRYPIPATLTGIVAIADEEDPFWASGSGRFVTPQPPLVDSGLVVPVLADVEAVLGDLGQRYPAYRTELTWNVYADVERLDRGNFERARADILALNDDFRGQGGFATSPLVGALSAFERTADFQRAPLTILLVQLAAIAIFYVAIVSVAVVERRAAEIALLRGRGSSMGQILGLYAMQGALVAVPAILIAPLLALAATSLLGLTPVFDDVSGGDLLPVRLELLAFPLAAAGALLSIVALLVPAFAVARRGTVAERRALARPGASFIQRYYLDLALVALALLALWELNERDSVFTPSATGGVSSDPLLLASPAIIIAAAAAALARLYPIALRLVTRGLGAVSGVTIAMGLWQLVRRPGPYTQLALLLMMAVAVGTFAASYTRTADRSYADRARFEAGVDLRAGGTNLFAFPRAPTAMEEFGEGLDGVEGAAAVVRVSGQRAVEGFAADEIQVLGVSPEAAEMLWWRGDFAPSDFEDLTRRLDTGGLIGGIPLPEGTAEISVWANPEESRDSVTLWARIRDANGRYFLLDFAKLGFTGWEELRTAIPMGGPTDPVGPLSLIALILTEPANQFNTSEAPLYLDDLGAVGTDGEVTPVEGFEASTLWEALPSRTAFADELTFTNEVVHGGQSAAALSFRRGTTGERRGIIPSDPNVPLPALVSDALLAQLGLAPGGQGLIDVDGVLVPFVVRESYELFPTMPSADGPSIVFNRDQLLTWARVVATAPGDLGKANELWLTLDEAADREAVTAALAGMGLNRPVDLDERLASVEGNPLIAASGTGILALGFLAVLVLVAVALVVSLWTGLQRRRVEFAVLRALGFTRLQVLGSLALEYAIVGAAGIAAGVAVGLVVGRRMLSFLNVTEAGDRVEPSFILETDWIYVAGGTGAIVLILAVALVAGVRLIGRTPDAQALRTE